MTSRLHAAALTAVLALASCARAPAAPRLVLGALAAPAEPGSGQANLALAPDGRVLLSWIQPAGDGTHSLRYAERAPGGRWSEARTVAAGSGWFVNSADFPSLAALPDGTLFAHWLAGNGAGYDVRVSVSRDQGRTWSAGTVPHRDGTPSEHGFVGMSPWGAGSMGLVWLDGRKTAAAGTAAEAETALMHATLDADGRLGPEAVLDGRVCDCCQTSVARAGGATVVAYRDRSERELRDISIVRFVDGRWLEPQPLARDGWEIGGCPVNGPALTAAGARVAVAWFTAAQARPRVSVAFSSDAGATFGTPLAVDDGRPLGRVGVVLLPDGAALVSWIEQVGESEELRVRRVAQGGARAEALTAMASSEGRAVGVPRMVASGGEVVLAWRDPAEPPRVRTALLTLAPPSR